MVILTNNERIQKMNNLEKQKLELEQQLAIIQKQINDEKFYELNFKNAINSTIKKINEVKKLYPFLKLETVDDCNDKKLFIRE